MIRVVDIRDLLDGDHPLPAVRRLALRLARLIEYGGPLKPGQRRETLVECTRRPRRKPCPGLLWVYKRDDGEIEAHCGSCNDDNIFISGWQETLWADGPMEPISDDELPTEH